MTTTRLEVTGGGADGGIVMSAQRGVKVKSVVRADLARA